MHYLTSGDYMNPMVEKTVKIGKLFKALERLNGIKFVLEQEQLLSNKIQIKNQNNERDII